MSSGALECASQGTIKCPSMQALLVGSKPVPVLAKEKKLGRGNGEHKENEGRRKETNAKRREI